MQAGLGEDGGRGDGLARSREPPSGDQLVADPARVAVIADERDRAEPSDGRPSSRRAPTRSTGPGLRGDRRRSIAAPLADGSRSSTRTGLAPARSSWSIDPQQREVHAEREGHGGDADDQRTKGHRGAHRVSEPGGDTEARGDADGKPESEPAQATPVAVDGTVPSRG